VFHFHLPRVKIFSLNQPENIPSPAALIVLRPQ
jgi:hypothetical protein